MTVWAKDKLLSGFEKGVGYQMTGVFFCDMIVKNIKNEDLCFWLNRESDKENIENGVKG